MIHSGVSRDVILSLRAAFRPGSSGRLELDGFPVDEAIRASGAGTPAYLYSVPALLRRFRALRAALAGTPHRISIPFKANVQPLLLEALRDQGAGAEAGSEAELRLAEALGFAPEDITLTGVGKTRSVLELAVDLGVGLVSVESAAELDLLEAVAASRGRRVRVLLRLNPELRRVETHPSIATGVPAAKFGMDAARLLELCQGAARRPSLEIVGVHAHIGSQILDPATFRDGAERLAGVFAEVRGMGLDARILDVGGGFGIPYHGEPEVPFSEFVGALRAGLASALGPDLPTILLEPGRSLFGPVGALVVETLHLKSVGDREFVVVDAGMNDLLRPALYGGHHRIVPVAPRPEPPRPFDVVGGVCETGDVFGRDRMLPPPQPGDLLALLDAGAYGFTMSSNYNLRPRPAEAALDAAGVPVLARPREGHRELALRQMGSVAVR